MLIWCAVGIPSTGWGQTSQWTGAGGNDNWFTAGNWDNGIPNLTTSVALVGAPAPTVLNGSTIIQSLMIGATGSLEVSPLQTLSLLNSGASLTNQGLVTLQTRARLSLTGTLSSSGQITLNFSSASDDTAIFVNTGGLTLDGGGVITLNGTSARIRGVVGGVLTIAKHTIDGRGGLGFGELQVNISSNSLVDANFAGAALTFQPGVQPAQNLGTLQGSSGGILVLNGSGGGQINNTGGLIVAQAGSEVQLSNGILLSGGTLTTVGDGVLRPVGSTNTILENLTNNGNIVTGPRGDITLRGTINSTGTITITPGNATSDTLLEIEASGATLTGGGVTTLAGGSSITGAAGGTLTVANQTIHGSDDFGRNLINVVVNSGNLVNANEAGRELILDPHPSGGFINQGTLQASTGGFLRLTGNGGGVFQNTGGVIIAQAGSEVITRDGAHIIGGILRTQGTGLIRTADSDNTIFENLSIQGDVTTASRGDITLRGVIDNQGTITINPGNATSGTLLEIEASGATLTGGGQIVMNGQTSTRVTGDPSGVLTLANQIVSGRGQLGSNQIGIINQATSLIHANVAGSALVLGRV